MATLNDFNKINGTTRVLAEHINDLLASTLRSEYSNVETLSGTRTLLDVDTPIQRLDCGGTDRIVKMPTPDTVDNHPFVIVNASDGGEVLTVKNNDATITLAEVDEGKGFLCVPDGAGEYLGIAINPALEAEPELQIAGDELTLKQRRDNGRTLSLGFDDGSLPAGFSWAGAPFATPATVDLTTYPSMLVLSHSASIRAFLYSSTIPSSSILPIINCGWALGGASTFVGLRFDDGSDNNYFEYCLSGDLKATVRTRVGGGSVATVQGAALPYPMIYGMRCNRIGTKYSSWGANVYLTIPGQGMLIQALQAASATTNASWTPTRFGIIFDINAAGYSAAIDAIYDLT